MRWLGFLLLFVCFGSGVRDQAQVLVLARQALYCQATQSQTKRVPLKDLQDRTSLSFYRHWSRVDLTCNSGSKKGSHGPCGGLKSAMRGGAHLLKREGLFCLCCTVPSGSMT